MRLVVLVVFAAGLAGCQVEAFERFVAEPDGFSVRALPGWEAERDRDAFVFRAPDVQEGMPSKTTIAIISVARSGAVTAEAISSATETVLRAMPDARLVEQRADERAELTVLTYSITFTPPGTERTYERRHVVAIGERHVFHLMHTAPVGAADATRNEFDQLVLSLREV